jgi:hypothetical protein
MAAGAVTLALVSHTNVGKTTLARTLLRRDVGEVRDEAHVTERSERHTLVEAGDARLVLYDTPGLGSSVRLLRRLRLEGNPIAWLLAQVWDRLADRPLWSSQQAIRTARDEADIVLYLVSAAEDPGTAGYVAPELELLTWIGRPVLVLLNQTGPALPMVAGEAGPAEARRLEEVWRGHAAAWPIVRDVLSLDAFSRCWVQEGILFARLLPLLPADRRAILEACAAAWRERSLATLGAAVDRMTASLVATAADREPVETPPAVPLRTVAGLSPAAGRRAMRRLRERLETRTRELVDALVAAHGLDGRSSLTLREHLDQFVIVSEEWLTPRRGAVIGGAVTGALGGLAADVAAAGLTFGGGAVLGALLGALGGAGLAAGYRLALGDREPGVSWSPEFLTEQARQTLLRYLAVAHFGRGRGGYADVELPDRWRDLVASVLHDHEDALAEAWRLAGRADAESRASAADLLDRTVRAATLSVLARGYPDASPWLETARGLDGPGSLRGEGA